MIESIVYSIFYLPLLLIIVSLWLFPNLLPYLGSYLIVIAVLGLAYLRLWQKQKTASKYKVDTFIKVMTAGSTSVSILVSFSSGLAFFIIKDYRAEISSLSAFPSPVLAAIVIFLLTLFYGFYFISSIATQEREDGIVEVTRAQHTGYPIFIALQAWSILIGLFFLFLFLFQFSRGGISAKPKTAEKSLERIYTDLFFDINKSEISADHVLVLDQLLEPLKAANVGVEITGFADSTGRDEHNLNLSKRRAESVKTYLTARGVEATRITTRFFGSRKSAASNDTSSGRQFNRRVVLRSLVR